MIAVIFVVIVAIVLLAIRAGGICLLLARAFSKLAAACIATAHCFALLDNLISHVFREGRRLYRQNASNALNEVLGG